MRVSCLPLVVVAVSDTSSSVNARKRHWPAMIWRQREQKRTHIRILLSAGVVSVLRGGLRGRT